MEENAILDKKHYIREWNIVEKIYRSALYKVSLQFLSRIWLEEYKRDNIKWTL